MAESAAVNQAAEMETILQERDACGVSWGSGIFAGWIVNLPQSHTLAPLSRTQVGFIASLKNHKSHTVVEQVRATE